MEKKGSHQQSFPHKGGQKVPFKDCSCTTFSLEVYTKRKLNLKYKLILRKFFDVTNLGSITRQQRVGISGRMTSKN